MKRKASFKYTRTILAVKPPSDSWGILSQSTEAMKCLTCRFCGVNCNHVKYAVESLERDCCPDFVEEFVSNCAHPPSMSSPANRFKVKCLSYRRIPFEGFGLAKSSLFVAQDAFSAVDKAEICHVCGAGPLTIHPAVKELTFFTQHQRKSIKGERNVSLNSLAVHCTS